MIIKVKILGIVKQINEHNIVVDNEGELVEIRMIQNEIQSLSMEQEIKITLCIDMEGEDVRGYLDENLYNFVNQFYEVRGVGFNSASALHKYLTSKGMSRSDICFEVSNGNADLLAQSPGIGNKTAYRIVESLKNKIKSFETEEYSNLDHDKYATIIKDLEALGFMKKDIAKAIEKASITDNMEKSEMLQVILQNI